MQEDIIRKINRMGHVAQIVALIFKILLILALLLTVSLTILSFGIADEALDLTISQNVDVSSDFSFTGRTLSKAEQKALLAGSKDGLVKLPGNITIDGRDLFGSGDGSIKYKKVTDHFISAYVDQAAPVRIGMPALRHLLLLADLKIALLLIGVFVASSLSKALRFCDSPFEDGVIRRLRIFAFSLLPWCLVDTFGDAVLGRFVEGNVTTLSVRIELGVLIIVLVLLGLTRIFKYGARLQESYDETHDIS